MRSPSAPPAPWSRVRACGRCLSLVAVLAAAGCGSGTSYGDPKAALPSGIAGSGRAMEIVRLNGGSMPPVFVERVKGPGWNYSYHILGEPFREAEFLGLCRTIARQTPDMLVGLVPATSLSEDEIGLVRARIRENGLENIRIVTPTGAPRRQRPSE